METTVWKNPYRYTAKMDVDDVGIYRGKLMSNLQWCHHDVERMEQGGVQARVQVVNGKCWCERTSYGVIKMNGEE